MVGCPIPAGWMDARQLCGDDGAAAFECLCREALVPVCIGQSKADPEFGGKLPSAKFNRMRLGRRLGFKSVPAPAARAKPRQVWQQDDRYPSVEGQVRC